jgi:DNA-binding LacI/PurR family transcriptional regulator
MANIYDVARQASVSVATVSAVINDSASVNPQLKRRVTPANRRPERAFNSNDQMAVGFMKALRQYQMRCPQDVAIVTRDDHPWIESCHPRLTTVDLPKYELGTEAARVLIARLAARDAPTQRLKLRSTLTIRDSCGYSLRTTAV